MAFTACDRPLFSQPLYSESLNGEVDPISPGQDWGWKDYASIPASSPGLFRPHPSSSLESKHSEWISHISQLLRQRLQVSDSRAKSYSRCTSSYFNSDRHQDFTRWSTHSRRSRRSRDRSGIAREELEAPDNMVSSTPRKRSPRRPTQPFHMKTRSRGSVQQPTPPASSPVRLSTPEKLVDPASSPPTGSLSSALESLGSTPEGLKSSHSINNESPTHNVRSATDTGAKVPESGNAPKTSANDVKPVTTAAGTGTGTGTPTSASPARKSRGATARGRGGFRGNRGRARGRPGRGRGGDSPDRKRAPSPESKVLVSALKARQQELRKFFSTVGGYQMDVLEQMASRDITKLLRKPKAHKQVPDYETALEIVAEERAKAEKYIKKRYEIAVAAEMKRVEAEREVIMRRFKTTAENIRTEHIQGAEGDIVLLRNAQATLEDDAHTNTGSEISEIDRFPRYHENPEPNTRVRGYYSNKITDERPFQQFETAAQKVTKSGFQDQVLRDVINDDLIHPVELAFIEKVRAERTAEAHKRTLNMSALCDVADQELRKMNTYTASHDRKDDGMNSMALSALADVVATSARQFPKHRYVFPAHVPRQSSQRSTLDWQRPANAMPPPPPPPRPLGQPMQYVFQQTQYGDMYAGVNNTPNAPVTFVNSTARNKKVGIVGPAKGGKRMLLPKGYASH